MSNTTRQRARQKARALTPEEILALPASVDLETAGFALGGLSRTTTFGMYHRGEFPCTVLKLGNQYRVPRIELLRLLGLNEHDAEDSAIAEPA